MQRLLQQAQPLVCRPHRVSVRQHGGMEGGWKGGGRGMEGGRKGDLMHTVYLCISPGHNS